MSTAVNRRNWLKQSSLAALALGFRLPSLANEEGITRNYGVENGLINLGANENPYGVSESARQAIINMIGEANRYSFNVASVQSFKKELSDHYGVTADHVLVTAGSGEALALLSRHFNKGNLVTATPTFGIMPSTSKKIGVKVIEIPLTADKVHDLSKMLSAITNETQLVYVVNPANPTGTIVKPAVLKNFCMEAAKKAMVVADEAYIDFLDTPDNESMIGLINSNPNIIVVRTFSKIHAMAGMRIGFVIAHPNVIKQLEQNYFTNSQFAVTNLSVAAAIASMKDAPHAQMSKQKNEAARNYTLRSLQGMNIHCIPSFTNFMFFSLGNYAGDYAADMLQKKILLRNNSSADGKWARVSIGTMEEMQQFVNVMKKTPLS